MRNAGAVDGAVTCAGIVVLGGCTVVGTGPTTIVGTGGGTVVTPGWVSGLSVIATPGAVPCAIGIDGIHHQFACAALFAF